MKQEKNPMWDALVHILVVGLIIAIAQCFLGGVFLLFCWYTYGFFQKQ